MNKKINLAPYFATGASNILLGFPTIGKSTLASKYKNVVEIKPDEYLVFGNDWFKYYVKDLKKKASRSKNTLFIACIDKQVISELIKKKALFSFIYYEQHNSLKSTCIAKAINRGSSDAFIKELENNCDTWQWEIEHVTLPMCKKIKIKYTSFLENYLLSL